MAAALSHSFLAVQNETNGDRLYNLGLILYQEKLPMLAIKYLSWAASLGDRDAHLLWHKFSSSKGKKADRRLVGRMVCFSIYFKKCKSLFISTQYIRENESDQITS